MTKKNRPTLSVSQLAAVKGVSRQAVAKAIASGAIPSEATAWRKLGRRRFRVIEDVALAARSWAPSGKTAPADEVVNELTESASATEARRHLSVYRAKRAQLDYELAADRLIDVDKAIDIFARQISEAKTAILAIGQKARGRLPHLTIDDVAVIEDLAQQALEVLAAGAIRRPKNKRRTPSVQRRQEEDDAQR